LIEIRVLTADFNGLCQWPADSRNAVEFTTAAEAKAAAQSDFNARVMSCLVAPTGVEVTGGVKAARVWDEEEQTFRDPPVEATPIGVEPAGYLFRLRYGPDHWSHQLMFSTVLPKEGDYKEVQPLYASPAPTGVEVTERIVERVYLSLVAASEWPNWEEPDIRGFIRAVLTDALYPDDAKVERE
jgi:hypothetical protein